MADLKQQQTVVQRKVSFSSYKDAEKFIEHFEVENNARFVKFKTVNHTVERLQSLQKHRVYWYNDSGGVTIPFTGVPFAVIGVEMRECHLGRLRKSTTKTSDDPTIAPPVDPSDHSYDIEGKIRRKSKESKKQKCPAYIQMRMIVQFPEYKIEGRATVHAKKCKSEKLREKFTAETRQEYIVFVQIFNEHRGHDMKDMSGKDMRVDKRIAKKIKSLVNEGIDSIEEIESHLDDYVKEIVSANVSKENRRFFPTHKCIKNHINIARNNSGYITRKVGTKYMKFKRSKKEEIRDVTPINHGESTFHVQDVGSEQMYTGMYTVDLKSAVPSCDCPEYTDSGLTCSHIQAVSEQYPRYQSNDLPPDEDNLDEEADMEINTDAHIESPTSEIVYATRRTETCCECRQPIKNKNRLKEMKMRNKCLEVVKQIQTGISGMSDVDKLTQVLTSLEAVAKVIQHKTVNEPPVPKVTGTARSSWQRTTSIKKLSGRTSNSSTVKTQPTSKVITEVWNDHSTPGAKLGQIRPYVLSDSAVKFIQSTLTNDSSVHIEITDAMTK